MKRAVWLFLVLATTASAQSLVFRGAPSEQRLMGRSDAIRVERLDVNGTPTGGPALMVTVTAPAGADVSTDPVPIAAWGATAQVSIGAGVSLSAPVYFRSGVRGVTTWRAAGAGFTEASANVLVRDDVLTCTMETGTTLDTETPPGCFNVLVQPFVQSTAAASASAAHRGSFGLRVIDADNGNGNGSDISVFDHGARVFGDFHARTWVRLVATNNQPSPIIAQLTNGTGFRPALLDVKLKANQQLSVAGFEVDGGYAEAFADAGLVVGAWHLLEFSALGSGQPDGGRYVFLDGRLVARMTGLDFSGTSMPVAQLTLGEPYADSRRWLGTLDFDDVRTSSVPLPSRLVLEGDGGVLGACAPVGVALVSPFGGRAAMREVTVVALDAGGTAEVFADSTCATRVSQVSIGVDASVASFAVRAMAGDVALEASNVDFLPGRATWRFTEPPDAGLDAGSDAGVDAGTDAGSDAGTDAGADAGVDAGSDAGMPGDDAGIDLGPPRELAVGCGCGAGSVWSVLLAIVIVARRGRRRG